MVDQPANNAQNFATTKKEPSVKFAAYGKRGSWFQTNGNLSRTVLQKKVKVIGFVYITSYIFSKMIAKVAKRTYFEVPHSGKVSTSSKSFSDKHGLQKKKKYLTLIDQ